MNTIQLLEEGSIKLKQKNILSHRIDSELLLSKVLKSNREKILINLRKEISPIFAKKYFELIERRSCKEPIAYILNEKEFWSKSFFVNKHTLVPRPETELLVDKLVKEYKDKSISILDIGTGSGCILISLLSELKNSKGVGLDVSKEALKVAKFNAKKLGLSRKIKFVNSPLMEIFGKKFDLIVSNPPYIKRKDIKNLECDIKNFEPKIALDGGNDGLDVVRKVIYKTKIILKKNGMLAIEIGNEQYKKVSKILLRNNFRTKYVIKDFRDNIRCILSTLKP